MPIQTQSSPMQTIFGHATLSFTIESQLDQEQISDYIVHTDFSKLILSSSDTVLSAVNPDHCLTPTIEDTDACMYQCSTELYFTVEANKKVEHLNDMQFIGSELTYQGTQQVHLHNISLQEIMFERL